MFELEYAQGMPDTDCATTSGAQCVGWGAIPSGGLDDMTKLHVMNMDLIQRPPILRAGRRRSNLMWQLVGDDGSDDERREAPGHPRTRNEQVDAVCRLTTTTSPPLRRFWAA